MKNHRLRLTFCICWVALLGVLRGHSAGAWHLDGAFIAGLAVAWLLTWWPWFGRAKVRP